MRLYLDNYILMASLLVASPPGGEMTGYRSKCTEMFVVGAQIKDWLLF